MRMTEAARRAAVKAARLLKTSRERAADPYGVRNPLGEANFWLSNALYGFYV